MPTTYKLNFDGRLLIIFLTLCGFGAAQMYYENESCDFGKYKGICLRTSKCLELPVIAKEMGLKRTDVGHCGFTTAEQIICCPFRQATAHAPNELPNTFTGLSKPFRNENIRGSQNIIPNLFHGQESISKIPIASGRDFEAQRMSAIFNNNPVQSGKTIINDNDAQNGIFLNANTATYVFRPNNPNEEYAQQLNAALGIGEPQNIKPNNFHSQERNRKIPIASGRDFEAQRMNAIFNNNPVQSWKAIEDSTQRAGVMFNENDPCVIKSHAGICAVQRNCPHLRVTMDLWGLSKEDVVHCGFTIHEEIICCPAPVGAFTTTKPPEATSLSVLRATDKNINSDIAAVRISDRPAEAACKEIEKKLMPITITHVYGGNQVAPGVYPHMVRLVYDDDNRRCGGTLISKRFVLTAAHCIELRDGKLISAILGVTDFNNTEEYNSRQEFKIKATYPHHNYSTHYHYFDIGLIELERDAEFSINVYPTCLSTNESDFTAGTELVVTGWGLTENQKVSAQLMEAKLNILPVPQCNLSYEDKMDIHLSHGIDETQLCAFAPGRDACTGDSGGPLHFVKDKGYGNYRVVGVVSFGQGCGVVPGVYNRVTKFLDFIEGIVWPGPV